MEPEDGARAGRRLRSTLAAFAAALEDPEVIEEEEAARAPFASLAPRPVEQEATGNGRAAAPPPIDLTERPGAGGQHPQVPARFAPTQDRFAPTRDRPAEVSPVAEGAAGTLGEKRAPDVTPEPSGRLHDGRSEGVVLDDETVDAARRGDSSAWEQAYRMYGKALMGFLYLRLGDADEAGEALSETFLRAMEKGRGFRGDAVSFRAWLYRIARNVAVDRLRVRGRVRPVADHYERADDSQPSNDERVIASEDATELRTALASLPADDREVLWLRICSGLSAAEVGKVVGKRCGAVRMQQMRALDALARGLPR